MKKGLLLLCLSLQFSCSQKVVSFINDRANFKKYVSYQLVNVKINKRKMAPEATQLLGTIESQIEYQMEGVRSYTPSSVGPDLILRYELVSSTNSNTTTNQSFLGPPTLSTRIIYESVILLELLDNRKLVWQGSFDLTQNSKEDRNHKAIKKAIDLIFTTYPYRAGRSDPDPSLTNMSKK